MDHFFEFLKLGFIHVLPLGYDHILFIMAIYFYNSSLRFTIIQCSIFTLAHSIALGFAAFGMIKFNAQIAETVIAASIIFVALENIMLKNNFGLHAFVIFLFGLFHGLGFAGAIAESNIPPGSEIIAILAFNLGVEFAQVALIFLLYFGFTKWMQKRVFYNRRIVPGTSLAIAAIAIFITVERILFVL